jgi:glycosyltransferase involved in cell wall biosynthesis
VFNPCAIVPVFNHQQVLEKTVSDIRHYNLPVVLVDDGSDEPCQRVMRYLAERDAGVQLIVRTDNGGKGAAVKTGIREAFKLGYSHGLQIDADGQHNTDDIPVFLTCAEQNPNALIAGRPVYDESVPKGRLYSRYLTHVWVWINTLSLSIQDSMCGFRVYPLQLSDHLITSQRMGDRMDFDSEFMVRWHWQNLAIIQLPTRVIYPENGISHFLGWRDNKLISWMHTRLFFGMLWRAPKLLFNKFCPCSS